MATSFPGALDVLLNPQPNDKTNVFPHAALHTDENDAIEAVQAKVGANGSAVQSSHDYKLSAVTGAAKAVTSTDARLTDARTPLAHSHAIADTTGLQGALDAKAAAAHGHAIGDVTNLQTSLDAKAPLSAYGRVTGSNVTTTGQALVDIAGLSIVLLANSVYEFEAILSVQASSTAGNQYGVQFSAAGAAVEAQISGTLAAATSRSDRINAINTAAPALVTSGVTGGVRIQGIITTGANAGNLTIRHLKVTSGTSTVFINSFLRTTKL